MALFSVAGKPDMLDASPPPMADPVADDGNFADIRARRWRQRRRRALSPSGRSDSDSVPAACARATASAWLGVSSSVAVLAPATDFWSLSCVTVWSTASTRTEFKSVFVAKTPRRAGNLLRQQDVHPVVGQDEAAGTGFGGDADRHRAHARRQHRGHVARAVGMHDLGVRSAVRPRPSARAPPRLRHIC